MTREEIINRGETLKAAITANFNERNALERQYRELQDHCPHESVKVYPPGMCHWNWICLDCRKVKSVDSDG